MTAWRAASEATVSGKREETPEGELNSRGRGPSFFQRVINVREATYPEVVRPNGLLSSCILNYRPARFGWVRSGP